MSPTPYPPDAAAAALARQRTALRARRRRAMERADAALRIALAAAGLRSDPNTVQAVIASLLSNDHDVKAVRR